MAIRLRTTNTNVLADALCRSSATVKTEFTRLCRFLGVHDRAGVIIVCMEKGWVGRICECEKEQKLA